MNLGTILLIIVIVLLIGAAPNWGYHSYGYYPVGGIGLILIILVILIIAGRL